jgi:hypothetical protein
MNGFPRPGRSGSALTASPVRVFGLLVIVLLIIYVCVAPHLSGAHAATSAHTPSGIYSGDDVVVVDSPRLTRASRTRAGKQLRTIVTDFRRSQTAEKTLADRAAAATAEFDADASTDDAHDVTLITQLSCRPHARLEVMRRLVHRWAGPVSVAVYVMNDAEAADVAAMYDADPLLQQHASLHLVYMRAALRENVLFKKYGIQPVYPINTLRNLALDNAHTPWALHVDVDFAVAPVQHADVRRRIKQELDPRSGSKAVRDAGVLNVFVLPAFEMNPEESSRHGVNGGDASSADGVTMLSKRDVRRLFDSGDSSMRQFAGELCPGCHGGTDYRRWFSSDASYQVPYTERWEPYVIASTLQPRYDEDLTGRHLNKNMHIWDLACLGYRFTVLPDAYVLHTNRHEIIPYIDTDYHTMEATWRRHVQRFTPLCRRAGVDMQLVRKWTTQEPKMEDLYMKKEDE